MEKTIQISARVFYNLAQIFDIFSGQHLVERADLYPSYIALLKTLLAG